MNPENAQPELQESGAEPGLDGSVRVIHPVPEWTTENIEGVPSRPRDALAFSPDFRADLETVGAFLGGTIAIALFVTNLRRGFRASALARRLGEGDAVRATARGIHADR